MDDELRQYLEGLKNGLERLNTDVSGLRTDFEAFKQHVDERFAEARAEMHTEIEKVETNLLRAFHGWARPTEIRVRSVSAVSSGFEERLSIAEERISEIERRQAS